MDDINTAVQNAARESNRRHEFKNRLEASIKDAMEETGYPKLLITVEAISEGLVTLRLRLDKGIAFEDQGTYPMTMADFLEIPIPCEVRLT